MPKDAPPLEIWCFLDGKPGHQNQTHGLVQALARRACCQVQQWTVPSGLLKRWRWRRTWLKEASQLPLPDLSIAAGHRTHAMLLKARRLFGGRTVVLMKPSLPAALFDLCVIPEHDTVKGGHVMAVQGVLNPLTPSTCQNPNHGLILIGGPCRHVVWSDDMVMRQLETLLRHSSTIRWTLTTSRRTPESMMPGLRSLESIGNLHVVPCTETPAGWVGEQLKHCGQVWCSVDSVSMIYESLTSGAATGLLHMPWVKGNKLEKGIQNLVRKRLVTAFDHWKPGQNLAPPAAPLAEADRVADWMMLHWFPEAATQSSGGAI